MNTLRFVYLIITVNAVITEEVNVTESILAEPKNAFKFEDQPAQSYGLVRFEDEDRFQQVNNLDNRFQQFDDSQKAIDDQRITFEDQERLQQYNNLDKRFHQLDDTRNPIDNKRIKFEGQNKFQQYNNLDNRFHQFDDNQNTIDDQKIKFEDQDNRNRPQPYDSQNTDPQRINFEDNRVNRRPNHQKKKRRRKPKRLPNAQGYGYRPYPGPVYPGTPGYPGAAVYPGPLDPGPIYPGQRPYQPSYPGPLYKPRPSATSAALSAVTEALTSIALYDDAQCVPRLLCEAAGGAVPGAGLLQSVAGLQPLLTLLAAYNGISSSPLFVFGRAVFLGMTSKDNPGTCRYAYAQCPNDPEQLVHYLNNHNGGFFRFFAAPELNQQQGLEQFYNQLSGQNYGFYQPQPLQQQNLQQGYGLQQNYQNQNLNGQSQQFSQYQNQYQQVYQNQNVQAGYGLAQHQYYNQNQIPNLYNGYGLYGQRYPHQNNQQDTIQKRIQNIRNTRFDNKFNSKWLFPEDFTSNKDYNNVRLGKGLKFPQSNLNSVAAAEGFIFPGAQSNREYTIDSIESEGNFGPKGVDDFGFYNYDAHGFEGSNNNDGIRILYVVRGEGDPNNPEIVRLAPGQTL